MDIEISQIYWKKIFNATLYRGYITKEMPNELKALNIFVYCDKEI